MANTITTLIENLPSTPDIAALSQMQDPLVYVTKISAVGNKKGQDSLVINGLTGLSQGDILKLQDTLPLGSVYAGSGPGVYRFEVTDQGSGAKLVWQIRLGGASIENAIPETAAARIQQATPMALPPAPPAKPIPPAPDAQNLGNGWIYNPALNLMTAPDGSLHNWRPGMPLPKIDFPSVPTASTPLAALPAFGAVPVNPENELLRQQLAVTQKALEDLRERERETQRQNEIRDLRDSFTKLHETMNGKIESIVDKLTSRPAENMELIELKRRLESQDQLNAIRAETKATTDAILALIQNQNNNKGIDPVVNILTTMLAQQQTSAAESFRSMREQAMQERETMLRMTEKQAELAEKSSNPDMMSKMLGGLDMIFDRMRNLTQIEREISSGGSGGVDWMALIKETMGRAGSALQVYQQAKAREADALKVQAQAQIAASQERVVATKAAAAVKLSEQRALAAMAAAEATKPSEETEAEAEPEAEPTAEPEAVPANAISIVPPTQVVVEQPTKANKPASKVAPSLETATTAELRRLFKKEKDEVFFGGFFEIIQQLRSEIQTTPNKYSAEDIAGFVLNAREYISEAAKKGDIPHAAEIFAYGQVEYLVERILPTVSEGLRSEILKSIKAQLKTEEEAERIAAAAGKPVV